MICFTGKELSKVPGDHMETECISLLCQTCKCHVAWVSLRELAGIEREGRPVYCFDCEPESDALDRPLVLELTSKGAIAALGLSNGPKLKKK